MITLSYDMPADVRSERRRVILPERDLNFAAFGMRIRNHGRSGLKCKSVWMHQSNQKRALINKRMSAISLTIITVGLARWTWTQGVKVVIRIDPSTVSIVPTKFYRVVSYGPNVDQLRIWHRDKLSTRAVALA